MDWLFGDQNDSMDQSLDSTELSTPSDDQFDSGYQSKTIIERSLDVSPIRKTSTNANDSYGSLYDFEEDLSFDKSKSSRKYLSSKRSLQFSPICKSTPKTSKTKTMRRSQPIRKKSYKTKKADISLWDKALVKSPELRQWINCFNDEMKKIESSELSITKSFIGSDN